MHLFLGFGYRGWGLLSNNQGIDLDVSLLNINARHYLFIGTLIHLMLTPLSLLMGGVLIEGSGGHHILQGGCEVV